MGRHKTVLVLVVAWTWAGWMSAQAAEPVWDITDSSGLYPGGSALTYRKLEVTFKLTNPCGNPYLPYPANPTAAPAEQADAGGAKADPNGVTVTGVFTVPGGGEVRMPAFWDGEGVWRLRICPTKPGQWSYVIEVVNAKGASKSEPRTFMVAESKDPGFIRPAPKMRFLQFERGGTFIPLGNNLVKTADTTIIGSWAKRLREHGMNSQRVWLHPHYTAIEWTADGAKGKSLIPDAPGLGQYLLRTARAMDYVVDQAQENGLYLLLCQDDMICYTSSPHDEPRIGWEYNPYKAICKDGIEFFTNEVAKRYYKARLRYMVARWAWSPHLFGWELMNEVDCRTSPWCRRTRASGGAFPTWPPGTTRWPTISAPPTPIAAPSARTPPPTWPGGARRTGSPSTMTGSSSCTRRWNSPTITSISPSRRTTRRTTRASSRPSPSSTRESP
jgi:hypothetical protein